MIEEALPTLAGAITGFAGSLLQPIVGYFQTKQANAHEIRKMEMQAQLQSTAQSHEMAMHEATALDKEHSRLVEYGKSLVEGTLRSLVRPIYALTFLGMFLAFKISVVIIGVAQGVAALDIAQMVWDPPTAAGFSTIFAFYFGGRFLEKAMAKNGR